MKVLTTSEMREADRLTTERLGIPSLKLMENAGTAVARFLQAKSHPGNGAGISVLCGKGNNGGDGLVAARVLQEQGHRTKVFLFADPSELRGDAAENYRKLCAAGDKPIVVGEASSWRAQRDVAMDAKLFVDALLGTGLRGVAQGVMAQAIEDINRRDRRHSTVVSVDIPSGVSGDSGDISGPAVFTDHSVTFTAPKLGMMLAPASDCVGSLIVVDIGTPRTLIEEISSSRIRWTEPWEFRGIPFRRKPESNKGNYGHALIVAGSVGKAGAAALSAQAALKVGAGLVTAAIPEPILQTVAGFAPEVMTEPLATVNGAISSATSAFGRMRELLRGKNSLAMGPGLSTQAETQEFVRSIIVSKPEVPVILDADGLNSFAGRASELAGTRLMLAATPHPGEMARLVGSTVKEIQARRLESARKFASEWQAHLILKGHMTVLAAPDGTAWINSTGNAYMATGGTGDVLTGILAGLTAQFGYEMWPILLALGVYLHGLAGDLAAAEAGEGPIVASDVIRFIPRALAQTRAEVEAF